MPEDRQATQSQPTECPFCGSKVECPHLMVTLNFTTRSITGGLLQRDVEARFRKLIDIGMAYNQAIMVIRDLLTSIWAKIGSGKYKLSPPNAITIEDFFWAEDYYEARKAVTHYQIEQNVSRGDFLVAPVDTNAFRIASPSKDEGVISDREVEQMELEKKRQEAESLGYPLWAQKFYANELLGDFFHLPMVKARNPNLAVKGSMHILRCC